MPGPLVTSATKSRTLNAPKVVLQAPLASTSQPPIIQSTDEEVGLSSEAGVLYKSPSVECSSIKRATLASLPHLEDAESWGVNMVMLAYKTFFALNKYHLLFKCMQIVHCSFTSETNRNWSLCIVILFIHIS